MERADLELVVAVARTGSLTAAARQLHVAQPALSRRLAGLERAVGAELFRRGRHGATPTAIGRTLVDRAGTALEAIRRAEQDTVDAAAGRAGRLCVGTTPTLGAELLPDGLATFRADHPGVRLELISAGDPGSLAPRVAAGELDLAVTVVDEPPIPGTRLLARGEQRFVLIVPAEAGVARRTRLPRRVLADGPLVTLTTGEGLRQLLDQIVAELGAAADIVIETAEREMLVPFVAAGLGASLVPESFARQRAVRGFSIHDLNPPVRRSVGIVVAEGPLPALVAAFADAVVATAWPDRGPSARLRKVRPARPARGPRRPPPRRRGARR
ncbi:MAG: LysR family transcriptional regulator [Acidimicrobiales bacterium]